jgi:hypothetical protein
MKKLLFLFLLMGAHFAYGQTTTLTGAIRNSEGTPVISANVRWGTTGRTKTDSTGTFSIKADLPVSLRITAVGYKDTSLVIDHQMDISIILRTAVNITAVRDRKIPPAENDGNKAAMSQMVVGMRAPNTNLQANQDQAYTIKIRLGATMPQSVTFQKDYEFEASEGDIFPQFNPKEETQGSRYLYKDWVPGLVIDAKGNMIGAQKYVYNYDKMGGGLLATKNGNSAIEVNRDLVKYFCLVGPNADTVTFANIPSLDRTHYVQVLSEGNKIGIYKVIKTKFERANYTTDGVMSQGNNYDSYTDDYTYFIVDSQTGKAQQISLKKKAIKSVFTADAPKVNKFMQDHESDNVDDSYLRSLGNYMNE